jgi:chaperonin cofactor prefoldin
MTNVPDNGEDIVSLLRSIKEDSKAIRVRLESLESRVKCLAKEQEAKTKEIGRITDDIALLYQNAMDTDDERCDLV